MKRNRLLLASGLIAATVGTGFFIVTSSRQESPQTREQVLREAEAYFRDNPIMACTQVITPAVHKASGVQHTFSTGCIPPGWEAQYDQ